MFVAPAKRLARAVHGPSGAFRFAPRAYAALVAASGVRPFSFLADQEKRIGPRTRNTRQCVPIPVDKWVRTTVNLENRLCRVSPRAVVVERDLDRVGIRSERLLQERGGTDP